MSATDRPRSTCVPPPFLEPLEDRLLLSGNVVGAALGQAVNVDLQPCDSVVIDGEIAAGESQVYRFTAPSQGNFYINMEALDGNLDTVLQLYTATGRKSKKNDSRQTLDSAVSLRVKPGQTYYVVASGKDETAGQFNLTLTSDPKDDFGNDLDSAKQLRMRKGKAKANGAVNYDGDVDTFAIVAENDGPVTLLLQGKGKGNGKKAAGEVAVYDSAGEKVQVKTSKDGQMQIIAVDGETYFVEVSGQTGSRYTLSVELPQDDFGNTIDTASAQRINPNHKGKIQGSIDYAADANTGVTSDVDVFSIVATTTGTMTTSMKALGRKNTVAAELFIYDSAGQLVAQTDSQLNTEGENCGNDAGALTSFDVVAGETYYIMAASSDSDGMGKYHVNIETEESETQPTTRPTINITPEEVDDPTAFTGDVVAEMFYIDQVGYQLRITGSNYTDEITVSQVGDELWIFTHNNCMSFVGGFAEILVYGGAGNDIITLDSSISINATVYAGEGNDQVYDNSSYSSYLSGGSGDDLLVSGGGTVDMVYGNDGLDTFQVAGNDVIADMSTAERAA